MQTTYYFANHFHGTSIRRRVTDGYMPPRAVRTVFRALCGIDDCMCSDSLGVRRGNQPGEHAIEDVRTGASVDHVLTADGGAAIGG